MERSTKRHGFTLVELLVVIAIIGILVSLLLPAVQAAREAGRRMSCVNNVKQLALAAQNYHDTMRTLPSSGISTKTVIFDPQAGKNYSWAVLMLPYIEQDALHASFDFNVDVFNQPNEPQEQHLPTLMCPSDSANNRFFTHPTLTNGKQFAKANYAAFVSPHHTELQNRFSGALNALRPMRLARITDGTSNTFIFSEVLTRDQDDDQRGAWALPWTGSSQLAFDLHNTLPFSLSGGGYQADLAFLGLTQTPNNIGGATDAVYDCVNPADALRLKMPCHTVTFSTSTTTFSAAPRSRHPGGVTVAMVDGSVKFAPNEIDELVMAHLISIDDGNPVSFE